MRHPIPPRQTGMPGARSKCVTRARADRMILPAASFPIRRKTCTGQAWDRIASKSEQRENKKSTITQRGQIMQEQGNALLQCCCRWCASARVARRARKGLALRWPRRRGGSGSARIQRRSPKRSNIMKQLFTHGTARLGFASDARVGGWC